MTDTVSESMARRIFELAVETGQSAKLLDLLFDGGSVTVDAVTGDLVMIPAQALAEMANAEPPEWCTCRDSVAYTDTIDWARREIAAFTGFGEQDGVALSANSCREIATWLQSLLTEHSQLEAIVRDLAECRINAATPEALSVTRERAKDWVAAHPVSGDPEKAATEEDDWHCSHCGSHRWVAASLTGPVGRGFHGKAIRQCVPCGHYSDDPVPVSGDQQ